MKLRLLLAIPFLFLLFFAGKGIRFISGTEADLGTISRKEKVVHTFAFENIGTDTLTVSEVVKTCGCLVANYTKTPVPPGAQGEIVVQYTPKKDDGVDFVKSFTVTFNNGTITEYLYLKGHLKD